MSLSASPRLPSRGETAFNYLPGIILNGFPKETRLIGLHGSVCLSVCLSGYIFVDNIAKIL